jgi:hypothetical protein
MSKYDDMPIGLAIIFLILAGIWYGGIIYIVLHFAQKFW